jgi:hypothetical protein
VKGVEQAEARIVGYIPGKGKYTGMLGGYEIEMMDSYDVVGTGPQLRGTRCFGAIMDKKAQLRSLELFPKMWDQEDPSQTFTMTQSAPLMVPGEPNGSFRIKVFS